MGRAIEINVAGICIQFYNNHNIIFSVGRCCHICYENCSATYTLAGTEVPEY